MKIPFTRSVHPAGLQKALTRAAGLLAVYGGLLGARSAQAQDYFIRDDFRTNSVTTFRIGGGASLTNTTPTGTTGYLRLTSNSTNQNGFAISKQTFNPANGFSISFEYFSYGGTTTDSQLAKGDGINLFLIDGSIVTDAANFVPGGYGGSLGYAQLVANPTNIAGATGGFIGIGLDEFGGYSAAIEGKSGGPGRVISGVAIRGAGNATTSATAYPYITGARTATYTVSGTTRTLTSGFGIDVATTRAQSTSADYRRVFVDVFPVATNSTTYKVTVRIQNGPTTVSTVIDNYTFTSVTQVMPSSLRIGFAASTGGSTNFHEVRDLQIVRPPVANNDLTGTAYNAPVSFSPLANDEASGSTLDMATLDLNPSTVAIDNTLTVPQGTFSVGSNGVVTFTPSGTFSGAFTVPYTVQSILKSISNQGTITVVVSGADVATSLNGPVVANIGSTLTYTTTTANVGVETGSGIVPKLALTGDIVVATSAAYTFTSTGTGATKVTTVTFPTIASLSPGDTPVDNSVSFVLTSGSVTGNASFTTSVPDPDTSNNTATLTTTGYNPTAAATGCGGPGTDGPGPQGVVGPDGNTIINTYFQGQGSPAAGTKIITLAGSGTGYSQPLMPGDLVLIMQMQGADITTANTTAYGAVSNVTAGTYEYAVVAPNTTVTYTGGGTLVLAKALVNSYVAAAATATAGPRRFQVIRVPQYSAYDATQVVTTGEAWNGTTGGVLVLDVVGATAFGSTNNTRFSMTGKGYRGGGGVRYSGNATYTTTDYRNVAATKDGAGAHGAKGEGIAGTPRFVLQDATSSLDLVTEAYPGGSVGQGAPGNGGGGGTDAILATNTGNTGGGGGSNAINTNNGGKGGSYNATATGGIGAVAPGLSADTRLFMGGGGGAGSTSLLTGVEGSGSGASGGGIVILRTGTVSGTGTIAANGGSAGNTTGNAAGGGGGGGAVLIASSNSMATITITATGGNGGSTVSTSTLISYGAGGGGSGGVVYNNGTSITTDPVTTLTLGINGTAKAGTNAAAASGATAGVAGSVVRNTAQNGGISSINCRPALNATLRANTPQVVRGSAMEAAYTLTVANSGGAVSNLDALVTLANGTNPSSGGSTAGTASSLFKYKSIISATITLPDNTVVTLTTTPGAPNSYTAPEAADDSPSFSNIDLPAGAFLTIKFLVDVSTTVENNTDYQSGVQVTYLDPTRTVAATTVSPGGTYAGTGAVPGSNYMSTSSTAEDVSVARPLPVELKQFSALAIRQDAHLTWATASERNSDRFYVERSWDGATFNVVGSLKAQGYSSTEHTYQYVDGNAAAQAVAAVAYYRLHQVDADGTDSYSAPRMVRFEKSLHATVSMYPNPAQTQLTLNLSAVPAGEYQIRILDIAGRIISRFALAGQQVHSLPLNGLLPGSYIVQVQGAMTLATLRLVRE